jgi:hypothetical protein
MPVFDFKNDWRDWRYHPVPSAESNRFSTTAGDEKPAEVLPVFSGYFWIYAAIAIGSMFFTFFLCWMFIGGTSADDPDGTKHPFRRHIRDIFSFIMESVYLLKIRREPSLTSCVRPPSWTQLKEEVKDYVASRITDLKGKTRLKVAPAEKPNPNHTTSPSPTHDSDRQDQNPGRSEAVELRRLGRSRDSQNSVRIGGSARGADDLV